MKPEIVFLGFSILIFILAGCSAVQLPQEPNSHIPFTAKAWFASLPEGEYSIGIAYADPIFGKTATALAKDFAAVAISRNHSSYVVDKEILLELADQSELDLTRMSFNFVVSADMDFLHQAARDLVLLDSFESAGLFLGLYGLQKVDPDRSELVMQPQEKPAWANHNGIYIEGNTLYSVSATHQAELKDAFLAAQEQALRQIAQYRLQNVVGKIRSINDRTDQVLALETVTRNQTCHFDKIFVQRQRSDQADSYTLCIQLKAEK